MSRNCRAFRDQVHALVDGQVGPHRAGALSAHATGCPPCTTLLRSSRRLVDDLARAAAEPPPPPPVDLVARIMERLPERPPLRLWLAVGGTAGVATAATAGIAVLASTLTGGGLPPLAPGLRTAIDAAGSYLARFAALFEAIGGGPGLQAGGATAVGDPSALPALALIATGLLGLAMALTLGAARFWRQRPVEPATF